MALTVTQPTPPVSGATATTTATSGSWTPTVGHWLVALIQADAYGGAPTITDTRSETWTLRAAADATTDGPASGAVYIATCQVATAGARTVTASVPGSWWTSLALLEVAAGPGSTIAVGAAGRGSSTSPSATVTALTSTAAGSVLVVSAINWGHAGAVPTSPGLTPPTGLDGAGTDDIQLIRGHRVLDAPGPQTLQLVANVAAAAWHWAACELVEVTSGGGGGTGGTSATLIGQAQAAIGSGTSLAVSQPAATAVDDFLLAVLWADNDGSTSASTPPDTSWQSIGSHAATGGVVTLWGRRATTAGSHAWTWGNKSDAAAEIQLFVLRGVPAAGPVQIAPVFTSAPTPTTAHAAPSVDATGAGLRVSGWSTLVPSVANSWSVPSGMTAVGQVSQTGRYLSSICAIEAVGAAGAVGARTATASAAPVAGYSDLSWTLVLATSAAPGSWSGTGSGDTGGGTTPPTPTPTPWPTPPEAGPLVPYWGERMARLEVSIHDGTLWRLFGGRVKAAVEIRAGRATVFDSWGPATCTVTAYDDDGLLMPDNVASPLYPHLREGAWLKVEAIRDGVTWMLFAGHITTIAPDFPDATTVGATVTLTAVDSLGVMSTTHLHSGWVSSLAYRAAAAGARWDAWVIAPGTDVGQWTELDNVTTDTATPSVCFVDGVGAAGDSGTITVGTPEGLAVESSMQVSPTSTHQAPGLLVWIKTYQPRAVQVWLRLPTEVQTSVATPQLEVASFWRLDGTAQPQRLGALRVVRSADQHEDLSWVDDTGTVVGSPLVVDANRGEWLLVTLSSLTSDPTKTVLDVWGYAQRTLPIDLRDVLYAWLRGPYQAAAVQIAGVVASSSETAVGVGHLADTSVHVSVRTLLAWLWTQLPVPAPLWRGSAGATSVLVAGQWADKTGLEVARTYVRSIGAVLWARTWDYVPEIICADATYPATPGILVDAAGDLLGSPSLIRSTAERPARITVGYAGGQVMVRDAAREASGLAAAPVTIDTLLPDATSARALAQASLSNAALQTRISSMTLDLLGGEHDLLPVLLGPGSGGVADAARYGEPGYGQAAYGGIGGAEPRLWPTQRVRLQGLPESHFPGGSLDAHIEGWTIRWGPGEQTITLDCSPASRTALPSGTTTPTSTDAPIQATGGGTGGGGSGGGGTSGTFLFGASGVGCEGSDAFKGWMADPSAVQVYGAWADASAAAQVAVDCLASGGSYSRITSGTGAPRLNLALGGPVRAEGNTWAQAASGGLDSRWQQQADRIKALWQRPYSHLFIDFARELNGGTWNPWYVTPSEAGDFKAAWARWRSIMKATLPGVLCMMTFNDGTGGGCANPLDLWPSPAPDILAVDCYNAWPHVTGSAGFTSKMTATGSGGYPIGLEAYRLQAEAWRVPMALSEWANGAIDVGDGGGGGDDPYWTEQMLAWLYAHAGTGPGQIHHAVWFNLGAAEGYPRDYRVFTGSGSNPAQPQTAAALRLGHSI